MESKMKNSYLNFSIFVASILLGLQPAIAEEPNLWQISVSRHAKIVCSGVFISGRTPEDILKNDHGVPDPSTVNLTVDHDNKTVTVKLKDGFTATAVYLEACGCTNLYDTPEEALRSQPVQSIPKRVPLSVTMPWPKGEGTNAITAKINQRKLKKAVDYAFDEPYDDEKRGTRGIVVVHKGKIIAEKYANGYDKNQPLIIWSMGKSIIGTVLGTLVKQTSFDIHKPAPVPEWADLEDPRHAITTDQLLRMSSGLKFVEEYSGTLVDVVLMLYGSPDTAAYPYKQVLHKIGMQRTIMEMAASGTYIGSSFTYSTPRDMARFGLFCMLDGVWNGERILPEGWIEYSTTPTAHVLKNEYGAQFWLNAGDQGQPQKPPLAQPAPRHLRALRIPGPKRHHHPLQRHRHRPPRPQPPP
jgi:CubicO group peptidase (beta-lactamase class C family)